MYRRLENSPIVLRVEDGSYIPPDPRNSDYQAYQEWLGAGNQPLPALIPAANVNAESDRRILSTLWWDNREWPHDTQGKENILIAGTQAQDAINNGAAPGDYSWPATGLPFSWVDVHNNAVSLDAFQMFSLASASAAWVRANGDAAQALIAMNPTPEDYKADKYWPTQTSDPTPEQSPVQVPMSSLRSVLIEADQEDVIDAAIKQLPAKRGKRLRHIWNGGGDVNRKRGELADFLKKDMRYTDAQLEQWFKEAKGFVA
jgi:hypothetical protein